VGKDGFAPLVENSRCVRKFVEVPARDLDYDPTGRLASEEVWFALCANAHLSDDETVAKMGHPNLDVGHPPLSREAYGGHPLDEARQRLVSLA
jgi:hypothetical protein